VQLRAYLVSGRFRVHRAGCRDCQREALRSDSPGEVEEFASKAGVIASLWSDIIAEDPGLYATPGGLASLEAGTVFLPCTSGLPDDGPAGAAAGPGGEEELTAWAVGLGFGGYDLDGLVRDVCIEQASDINIGGFEAQLRFLVRSFGTEGARSRLTGILRQTERARLRRRSERPPPAPRG
jgi:hypothetical protein